MRNSKLLVSALVAISAVAAHAATYQYDDGTSETSLFNGATSGNVIALNQFASIAGSETLTAILISWGSKSNMPVTIPNTTSVTILLLSDPNQDGNPNDSGLLQQTTGQVNFSGTDAFVNYTFSSSPLVPPGTKFFVGLFVQNRPAGEGIVGIDNQGTAPGKSWYSLGGSPGNATYSQLAAGNFMIRANGVPVPEPVSIATLAIGAIAALKRRRK